ncbi:unnamed protein product [Didymodactylos carnosus]|uniref:Uncharacterized protein n=1 Tax=Didymodactylos carnosus TaxID=1234261 RepID=A0A8S2CSR7_9BILA|nr:unnamed protein product [Didymodactylos carnosus]CAF3532667.1 unnamed protein product [Didymodactylos carnosus]
MPNAPILPAGTKVIYIGRPDVEAGQRIVTFSLQLKTAIRPINLHIEVAQQTQTEIEETDKAKDTIDSIIIPSSLNRSFVRYQRFVQNAYIGFASALAELMLPDTTLDLKEASAILNQVDHALEGTRSYSFTLYLNGYKSPLIHRQVEVGSQQPTVEQDQAQQLLDALKPQLNGQFFTLKLGNVTLAKTLSVTVAARDEAQEQQLAAEQLLANFVVPTEITNVAYLTYTQTPIEITDETNYQKLLALNVPTSSSTTYGLYRALSLLSFADNSTFADFANALGKLNANLVLNNIDGAMTVNSVVIGALQAGNRTISFTVRLGTQTRSFSIQITVGPITIEDTAIEELEAIKFPATTSVTYAQYLALYQTVANSSGADLG